MSMKKANEFLRHRIAELTTAEREGRKAYTSFDLLPLGARFEFHRDSSYSGLESGPWTKISARKYEKTGPRAMVCRVGSIHVLVQPL